MYGVTGAVQDSSSPALRVLRSARRSSAGGSPRHPAEARRRTGDVLRAAGRLTDGELVTLALNGVQAAFSRLMERHGAHLRRVIVKRLRDPDDVLDAIQDTHFAVWRALQHYDAGRPFEAWLTSIALNKCRDWARRRTARVGLLARLQEDALYEGAPPQMPGIERLLIGHESVRKLGRALGDLSPQLRAPLLLTTMRERSQTAAARELGITRKAVEMRVRRARQHLREALA